VNLLTELLLASQDTLFHGVSFNVRVAQCYVPLLLLSRRDLQELM